MKQELLEKLYQNGKLLAARTSISYLQKVNLYDRLINYSNFKLAGYKISEIITCIINDADIVPFCTCGCNSYVKINYDVKPNFEFRKFKSAKCAASQSDFKKRFSKVNQKEANEKRKSTMLLKYGVTTNSQRPEIKQLMSENMTKRYLSDEVLRKLTDYDWMYEEYQNKKRTASDIASDLGIFYGTVIVYLEKLGFEIRQTSQTSQGEKEVVQFIEGLSLEYIENSQRIINPRELDIYIPSHKLAIEFNGILWHSSFGGYTKKNHKMKYDLCKDQGIRLLQIFDDEWREKKDIWQSIIMNKLGLSITKIFARNTSVKAITSTESRKFLEENHLHGFVGGSHYALIFDGDIVMSLTYGKSRFDNSNEIIRICTKKNHNIVGGLSKLLKNIPDGHYTTFSDLRFSTEGAYNNSFEYLYTTEPNYYWVDKTGYKRISRNQTQKHKLKDLLGERFDPTKSERINMMNAGYYILYDCGNAKFKYVKQ